MVVVVIKDKATNDRAFVRIVKSSSGLALGTMAALFYSLKHTGDGLRLEISVGSVIAFALGGAFSWAFWRLLFGSQNETRAGLSASKKRWFVGLSVFLSVATLVPFGYALKDLPRDKAVEVAQGAGIALAVLSALGFLFRRLTRFLETDSKRTSDGDQRPAKSKQFSD